MKYSEGKPEEMKEKFWKALADSPFVMLQLDADPDSTAPMTAQLDKDANHAIWFFTSKDNRFATLGAATANFESKGHDVFARFSGTLTQETSRERLDKQWNNFVEAWFPGGKDDPNLLMLRMDLGDASIWAGDLGLLATAKMALGMNVREEAKGSYAETAL
ncbi:pyridoxamine 5'-phosphate oxidase family protein [Novosphingobium tardum]|uniref:Pyridoxamine 5'-phosphate oxidase family protein n=1 Tax=Novosphingobium tardum TaxID=1538021 RepID=A0ABV8RQ88_9SPHN